MRRRRVGRVTGGVALAVLVFAGTIAGWKATEVRVAWHRWWLGSEDADGLEARLEALVRLGDPGWAAIEDVAFDPEPAEPGAPWTAVRSRALDLVYDARDAEADELRVDRARLYLREALGLPRGKFFDMYLRPFLRHEYDDEGLALLPALIAVVHEDPDVESAGLAARSLVHFRDRAEARAAIEKAAVESPHAPVREQLARHVLAGAEASFDRPILRRMLADPDEVVRVAAAARLAQDFRDMRALPVLLAALRPPWSRSLVAEAIEAMVFLPSPHVIAAIARAFDRHRWTGVHPAFARESFCALVGTTVPPGRSLRRWLDARRHLFPPQYDADAIDPGPVFVEASDSR